MYLYICRLKIFRDSNLVYFKEVLVKLAHLTPFSPKNYIVKKYMKRCHTVDILTQMELTNN